MAEHLVDALDQTVGDRVLEPLGLVVHLAPVVAHLLDQEELDQPMAAQHVGGEALAGLGRAHARVGLVGDQAALGQRLHHRGHRAGSDAERRADLTHGDERARLALLRRQDALEVVLDRGSGHRWADYR